MGVFTGRGDLRRFRAAPAGGVPVPPAGHAHRALLQVQVQQRRRRPAADLKAPSEAEQGASSRTRRPFLFISYFVSSKFCPSLRIFWAEPAPAPAARGSIALHEGGGGDLGLLRGTSQTS